MARLRDLINGFWLVPGIVTLGLVGLAFALVRTDHAIDDGTVSFAFDGDAAAARAILQTIAGSLVTVAGLVFSLTVVVLVLVSGQFTPRSVPAFLADRVNQVTAGAFTGIVAYCLLVLRTVRNEDGGEAGFVPGLSVTVAVALALLALAVLLYFIHHLGTSIQASSIVNRIGTETLARIDELPDEPGDGDAAPACPGGAMRGGGRPGYVRHIALDQLAARLPESCEHVRLTVMPGDFVTGETVLAEVWPPAAVDDAEAPVRNAVVVAIERDLPRDVHYGVRQLAEIAMKGLSPGINDPTTAVSAIGYAGAALELLAGHSLPHELRRSRVSAPQRSFDEYVEGAFGQVGRYASGDASVVASLLDALGAVAEVARRADRPERLAVLVAAAEVIAEPALADSRTEHDRKAVLEALAAATGRSGARRS